MSRTAARFFFVFFTVLVCSLCGIFPHRSPARIFCLETAIAAERNDEMVDSTREWYFYKKERVKPEKEEEKKDAKNLPNVSDYSVQQLWDMHPDNFKELLDETQKRMIQYPGNEKLVADWVYMKDMARRKALAATSAEVAYLQMHPEYSMQKEFPTMNAGTAAAVREKTKMIESRLIQEKGNFGFLYFYSPTCEFCKEQSRVLDIFIHKYGWDIKNIDVTIDDSGKELWHVTTTPTLVLVQRSTGESMVIAVGVMSVSDMEETTYRAMRYLKKEITPEQWNVNENQDGGIMDPMGIFDSAATPHGEE